MNCQADGGKHLHHLKLQSLVYGFFYPFRKERNPTISEIKAFSNIDKEMPDEPWSILAIASYILLVCYKTSRRSIKVPLQCRLTANYTSTKAVHGFVYSFVLFTKEPRSWPPLWALLSTQHFIMVHWPSSNLDHRTALVRRLTGFST